uniref:p2C58 n=1 Tax=Arundo donax TaxID=35708 RepID=A0A0A9CRP9_ARUDO
MTHHSSVFLMDMEEKWLPNSVQNIYTEKFSIVKPMQLVIWARLSKEHSSEWMR